MSTFAQIRNQSLNLETQTDQLLAKYAQYQKSINVKEDPAEETQLVDDLNDVLAKRDDLVAKLNRINEFENLSTSKLQQLTRHKEILLEHKKQFARIENALQEAKNRNNLLFSIRSDIDQHKQRTTSRSTPDVDSNAYILDESVRVNEFNSFADRLLQSAYQTRDELLSQRNYLNSAASRIASSIATIPGIGVLISKINTRRKRDTLILATVISLCILLLFFF